MDEGSEPGTPATLVNEDSEEGKIVGGKIVAGKVVTSSSTI